MLTFHDDALRSKIKADPPKPQAASSVAAALDAIAFLPFGDLASAKGPKCCILRKRRTLIAFSSQLIAIFEAALQSLRPLLNVANPFRRILKARS